MSFREWEHKAVSVFYMEEGEFYRVGPEQFKDWNEVLATHGASGWQLVSVVPEYSTLMDMRLQTRGFMAFFRRPVTEGR